MIRSVKKIPILRYGLIVLLVLALFSGAFYLYVHYNSAQKLQSNISKLIRAHETTALIDSCLLNLYSADNNSRLYTLTGNKKYAQQFSDQVNHLNVLLNKVWALNSDTSNKTSAHLKQLIAEKIAKTNYYMEQKRFTDSLLNSTLKIDSSLAHRKIKIPVTRTIKTVVHTDTINNTPQQEADKPQKKPFLGRVIAAITGKSKQKQQAENRPAVVQRSTVTQTITQSRSVYNAAPLNKAYQKLYTASKKLKLNEHDILLINNNLLNDIVTELQQYKTLEVALTSQSKAQLKGNVSYVFKQYNSLSRLTLIALTLLIIIVLYNVWKLFMNDKELIAYSRKAEEYADNKSRFMASMSHEIRTPLNSVIGFSEQLSTGNLTTEQAEQVSAIRSSSQMLLDVVNEILDFSKYETGKMNFEHQPFMPYQALNEVLTGVSIQAAKKGLILNKNIQFDEDICFSGDVLRLKQVITNLLMNAIKFTPSGEVMLQARLINTAGNKTTLKVRVKDTGIGIKKHDLPLIFDEFAQVNDAQKVTHHKGTGLGLAICKKIVELQGGTIRVTSSPRKGSIFGFELPFDLDSKENCIIEEAESDTELIKIVAGARVLLAEDNQLNVLLAKTILKKWQINYDIAYNGQEAFELFKTHSYDLVLTDIQMPVMGGLELLALIRKYPHVLKAETPVIALTANVLKEDRDVYTNAGMNDIVLKPFVERNLVGKIAQLLRLRYVNTGPVLFRYG